MKTAQNPRSLFKSPLRSFMQMLRSRCDLDAGRVAEHGAKHAGSEGIPFQNSASAFVKGPPVMGPFARILRLRQFCVVATLLATPISPRIS